MDNQTQLVTETDDILRHIDSLQVAAIDAYSSLPGRTFVPKVSLRDYLSRERVKTLLKFCGLSVIDWHTIHRHYLTVFVILLVIGKGKYISHFRAHDALADDQLPFYNSSNWPSMCLKLYDKFHDAQWRFCAQELRANRLEDRVVPWKRIIPITSKAILKNSADSETYRVEIHSDYAPQSYKELDSAVNSNAYVLKVYRGELSRLHYNEVRAYKMLSHKDVAPNVVHFYGSWKHGDTYNLLLEFIPGETLASLFTAAHPTTTEQRLSFWLSMTNILGPVCRIHCHTDPDNDDGVLHGVHQDIQPSNILAARDVNLEYMFKLIDFELTHFSAANSSQEISWLRDAHGVQTYSAPECFRNEYDGFDKRTSRPASPSKDVFSLGCVFSEALVWSALGAKGVETYRVRRRAATERLAELTRTAYSGCFHDGEHVLSVVRSMHKELRAACGEDLPVMSNLALIIEDMLSDHSARPSAPEVRKRLLRVIREAKVQ